MAMLLEPSVIVRVFLYLSLGLRVVIAVLIVMIGMALTRRMTTRGSPQLASLIIWVWTLTASMIWYVLANFELWVLGSAYMQTFGVIVWLPVVPASLHFLRSLRQSEMPAGPTP